MGDTNFLLLMILFCVMGPVSWTCVGVTAVLIFLLVALIGLGYLWSKLTYKQRWVFILSILTIFTLLNTHGWVKDRNNNWKRETNLGFCIANIQHSQWDRKSGQKPIYENKESGVISSCVQANPAELAACLSAQRFPTNTNIHYATSSKGYKYYYSN